MLLLPLAAAPAPPATASVPVAFGFGSLLVLFTWNIPSAPFWILVTLLITAPVVSLSCATFTASVSAVPLATLVI
ncbi:hypothetical protein D3C71_2195920 [compost metagenome]